MLLSATIVFFPLVSIGGIEISIKIHILVHYSDMKMEIPKKYRMMSIALFFK